MSPLQTTMSERGRRRRGISSLELVLVLPVLLFVTAMIINFGTVSTLKIRALVASRDAVWKTRWPRANLAPAPVAWPSPSTITLTADDKFTVLDEPTMNVPVARGPLSGATVNEDLLDPTRGPQLGRAESWRKQPIPPSLATFHYDAKHVLLTDPWTYDSMGMDGNVTRRTKVLYALAKAPTSLSQAFISAVAAVYYGSFQQALLPLEHEPDYPRFGRSSPDFQPRMQSFCGTDADRIRAENVENLIDRIRGNKDKHIDGVPETMTHSFISLYQGALQTLQSQLNNPALTAAQKAAVQQQLTALKAELDPKIAQLEEFLASLSGS